MKALIYCRVSQDKRNGRSVQEQEDYGRAECQRRQWSVMEPVIVDNSIGASGYSRGTRHGWTKVLETIASGKSDVLVVWKASRAQRDMDAYFELEKACRDHNVLLCSDGKVLDLSKGNDRFNGGLDALLARRDADEISENVCRAMSANARNGKPHGRIPYGYKREFDTNGASHQVPDPIEAPIVQRIFDQYLAGIGQRRIANALKADSLVTRGGAAWSDIQVKRVLANPTYAGKRVYRGEVVGTGDWPALVSADVWERAQERIRALHERKSNVTGRASLLAGLARCSVCNGRMTTQTDRKSESGRRYYICRENHCVSRDKAKLDAYVTAVVLERLALPDVRDALGDSEPDPAVTEARQEVERLRSEIEQAMSLWSAGKLSVVAYSRMERELGARITDAESAMPRLAPLTFDLPAVDAVPAWWDALDHEQHREVVAALLSAVVVAPTGRGARHFDPGAVALHWR